MLSKHRVQEGICQGCGKKTTWGGAASSAKTASTGTPDTTRGFTGERGEVGRDHTERPARSADGPFSQKVGGAKLKKTSSKACADRRALERVGRSHRGIKFTKLITVHREFANWLKAWEKRKKA